MVKLNFKIKVVFITVVLTQISAFAIDRSLFSEFESENLSVKIPSSGLNQNAIELAPLLIKPPKASPWNVIVLPSNCSGLDDKMWRYWTKEFIKNDIAVVLVDSFNPRGFSEVCTNQFKLSFKNRLQDVHSVLDVIRTDSRFNKDKIAIGGHSVGAITTLQSSFSEVQNLLARDKNATFNAYIAAAPSCELTLRTPELSAPLLIIAGELDDWTKPEPCKQEINRLVTANQNASILIVPSAFHTFSTTGTIFNPRLMKAPEGMPHLYFKKLGDKAGETTVETVDGETTTIEATYRKHAGFMGSKVFGATSGGNYDKAQDVANYSVEFLKKLGW